MQALFLSNPPQGRDHPENRKSQPSRLTMPYVIIMSKKYDDIEAAKHDLEEQVQHNLLHGYTLQGSSQIQFDPKEGKWFAFQAMVQKWY